MMVLNDNIDISYDAQKRLQKIFLLLAAVAVTTSAFHFWPFDHSKTWKMMNLSNFSCLLTFAPLIFMSISKKYRVKAFSCLPHISVFAYLIINFLSISFAVSFSRSVNYVAKLAVILIGGYFLFRCAASNERFIKIIYKFALIAALISVSYCLFTRFSENRFGFHNNYYKYGTYIGTLVPLCGTYLLLSTNKGKVLLGEILIIAAIASSGSLGGVAAIFTGLLTVVFFIKSSSVKYLFLVCLVLSAPALFVVNMVSDNVIWNDFKLLERDGINLRQRYIEWQAEINLLEDRGITGTGAGCVNDFRSNFYYRLPKLNTLKAFDQNGWLAVGAEAGILGLLTFCWIVIHYGKVAVSQVLNLNANRNSIGARFATANLAGFTSACVANLFSSIQYNGILIIFVLVLSLISATNQVYGKVRQ